MPHLAINNGQAIRNIEQDPWPSWPVWNEREAAALLEVLHSGIWSYNGPKEEAFNKQFAEFTGTEYSLCAVNGTVTLQLALEALGVGVGDEVIVPGLTWQATAATVLDVNAVPVLVDVCADTWCIDPQKAEAAITPRTKAIIPVHLYGSFADMTAIMELARQHDLFVIEDCAHKHGGEWNGQKAGSIGHVGSFSFQLSKLLTAGEGGALTTNDPLIAERLDALRNCGRRPVEDERFTGDKGAGHYVDDGNFLQSGNYRITEFQAAILLEGLRRLPEQNEVRDRNGIYLNGKLSELPGVTPLRRDERETREAYFNFAFRYDRSQFKDLPVEKFRAALAAELGISVDACYEPLNKCALYVPHTKPAKHKLNDAYWAAIDPKQTELPVCDQIFFQESVCVHHKLLMGTERDMDLVVAAISKIYKYADELLA